MYNQLQEAAQAQDDQLEAQVLVVNPASCAGSPSRPACCATPGGAALGAWAEGACVAADLVAGVGAGPPVRGTGSAQATAGRSLRSKRLRETRTPQLLWPLPTRAGGMTSLRPGTLRRDDFAAPGDSQTSLRLGTLKLPLDTSLLTRAGGGWPSHLADLVRSSAPRS